MTEKNAWHIMDEEQIARKLESNLTSGLGRKQAIARAKKLNIRQPEALSPLFLPARCPFYKFFGKMFLDPIMILTLFVALIIFMFGEYLLGAAMIAIIVCNAACCAFANAKAYDVWQTMQLYSNPMVKVIRGGKLYTTDARNVVPGDIVVLTSGDVCPADVRLQKGSSLYVKQYTHVSKDHKKVELQYVHKNGDHTYLPRDEAFSPNLENIVYAGSVVEQGYARGIVVETGRNTYIGTIHGTVPGTEKAGEPDSIAFIRKYFVSFSTVQAILLVPLTIIMAITLRETHDFDECFMTALALCCTAIAEHVVALAGIVRATGIDLAATKKENASLAIVKNSRASDQLCQMTDLFLLDSSAISDGKHHLESVYAGGSIYNNRELVNKDVYQLASDLYLYRSATRPPDAPDRDRFDVGVYAPIDALIKHVGVDTAAIDLTKVSSHMTYSNDECHVYVKLKQGECEVLVSENESILRSCEYMMSGEEAKLFDENEYSALSTLCRIYRESGYKILLVANRKNGRVTLMGVLAFAQRTGYEFEACSRELLASGVRISVFMEQTSENMKILTDCGLVRDENNDVLTAARAEHEGLDLHVAYGSYRAYLGFSKEQIADLIERLHQRGNRIASYCVDHSMQPLHEMADLRITCDAMEYRSAKVSEALYEKMPVDGKSFSTRASQNTRRSSDVILRRAGSHGGGLHGILTGRKYAFAVNHNLANMVTYLITVQFFRLVLATVPAMFGTYTLSAVALMICGLIVDVAAVILFAFSMPSKSAVSCSYDIMRRLEKPIAYNTANVISACVSALTLWLGIALLQVFGVLNATECMGLSFTSTYLLQGAVFFITWREYSKEQNKGPLSKPMLIVLLCYVAILVLGMFVPGLNGLLGTVGIKPMILGMSLFAPVVYYVMYRVLSANGLNLHK